MKLSLWTLFDWLCCCGLQPTASITKGEPVISRVILQEHPRTGKPDSSEVWIYKEAASDGTECVAVVSGADIIRISGVGTDTVCNELGRALEFYNNWELQLLMALLDSKPIQALLDLANTVFRRPMFIKNTSNWTFAITDGYDDTVHPYWSSMRESVVTHRSIMEPVQAISTDPEFRKVFTLHYPAIQRRSPSYGGPVLHANVWLKGHRICEIVALENGRPFNPGDPHLMYLFVSIVERYMLENPAYYFSLSNMVSLFVKMLNDGVCSRAALTSALENANWAANDDLAVISVSMAAGGNIQETPIGGVLQEHLRDEFWFGCIFAYEGRLVCVVNLTKGGGKAACISLLERIVPRDVFVWAMSYEFSNPEQMPLYYQQSLLVLERAIALGLSWKTMHQVAMNIIRDQLKSFSEAKTFIHPDVYRLKRIDRQNDSQYFQTLFSFLLSGGNYTDAANLLGLHRNTLIYRISRIEEIISADLNSMNDRQQLLFSFLMLGETGI